MLHRREAGGQAQRAGWHYRAGAMFAALALVCGPASAATASDEGEVSGQIGKLRFNQIQYIGTHNSYHIAPWLELGRLSIALGYGESADWPARKLMIAVDFSHPSLTEQLAMGLRQFEIDVHADPVGGKFREPGHLAVLRKATGKAFDDFDPADRLGQPGFKVFHGGIDMRSQCLLLRDCLTELKRWSDANPRHFPIVIHVEAKDGSKPPLEPSYRYPDEPAFGLAEWEALENEVVSVIGADRIVSPQEVQGSERDAATAIKRNGWPTLDRMAGRFVLLLLNKKTETESYLRAQPKLTHGLFFTSQAIESKSAMWFRIPDPNYPQLRSAIARGQMVTVQSDTHTYEARTGSVVRREAAFTSGAHFILTDYPVADRRFTDYHVRFPGGGYVRCNPRTHKAACPF